MDGSAAFTGVAPRTASNPPEKTDPTVSGGKSIFENLTEGGLFTLLANYKRPLVVEAVLNENGATATLESRGGALSRPFPTAPFKVSPNEVIKFTGGSNGAIAGVLVRIDGEKQL